MFLEVMCVVIVWVLWFIKFDILMFGVILVSRLMSREGVLNVLIIVVVNLLFVVFVLVMVWLWIV